MQKSPPKSNNFSDCESKLIDIEINKLRSKGVITPCRSEKHEFISRIFLRPKKDGTSRLILNLKSFNKNVEYHHFKMDTLHSILKLVRKNCWMASVDLKDAYYSCPVALRHQKYLKFSWKNQLYKYVCFPNGLACCPRKFTKLMKPALSTLRKKGHISAAYIDDTYLQGESKQECKNNVFDTVTLFHSLGLVAHPDKSVFEPTQKLVILGFEIDSVKMIIKLTSDLIKQSI